MERVICNRYPGTKITFFKCLIKYIDRKHLKIDVRVNASEPVEDIWVRGRIYYKYNTYQRFGGEIWTNVCDWLAGKARYFVMDWIVREMLKYTNLNHTCPYEDHVYFKVNNISVATFAFPQIVPSGRYRVDMIMTESDQKKILMNASIYFSVSDHRIEIV